MMISDLFVRSLEPVLAIAFGAVATLGIGVVAWWRRHRRRKVLPMEKWGKLR